MSSKKNISLLLLDVGGVIYQVDWSKTVKFFNLKITSDEIQKSISKWNIFLEFEKGNISPIHFYQNITKKFSITVDYPTFIIGWNKCLIGPTKGIFELLNNINIKIAALSNTNIIHYNNFSKNAVFKNFSHIITSFNLNCRKPDKEIYIKALHILDIIPEQILFIDDLPENLQIPASLGMFTETCLDSTNSIQNILLKHNIID